MQIVSGHPPVEKFAKVPETVTYSGLLLNFPVRIWAYTDAHKSDHTAYGKSMSWPVFRLDDLAETFQVGKSTVQRAVSSLVKYGFLKTTKTKQGLRFELSPKANIADDYRGFENEDRKVRADRFTPVPRDMITSNASDGALRVWMMADRIGGNRQWVYTSQVRLAGYLRVTERQVKRYIAELTALGLIESKRRMSRGRNDYRLSTELIISASVKAPKAAPVVAPQSAVKPRLDPADRYANDGTGRGLVHYFRAALRRSGKGKKALGVPGAVDLVLLASVFNRWMAGGKSDFQIRCLIDNYVYVEYFGKNGAPVWKHFLAENSNNPPEWEVAEAKKAFDKQAAIEATLLFNGNPESFDPEYWSMRGKKTPPAPKTFNEAEWKAKKALEKKTSKEAAENAKRELLMNDPDHFNPADWTFPDSDGIDHDFNPDDWITPVIPSRAERVKIEIDPALPELMEFWKSESMTRGIPASGESAEMEGFISSALKQVGSDVVAKVVRDYVAEGNAKHFVIYESDIYNLINPHLPEPQKVPDRIKMYARKIPTNKKSVPA